LAESSEEVNRLIADSERLANDHARERKENDQQIHLMETQLCTAESGLEELKDRMDCAVNDLHKSHEELGSVQKERLSLQECITNLEAELQKSVSMTRFLESKVKEWQVLSS
jgi:chromosome segregation ATPase